MFFQLLHILYWLALASWFGGVLFVAVAAPIIFRTVFDAKPVLPDVLSVNLENQHATLLAGTIVSNLLVALTRVQLVCAIVLAMVLGAQAFVLNLSDPRNVVFLALRGGLFLAAAGILVYHWRWLWPRIVKARTEYVQNADNPELANPARLRFNHYHRQSVSLLSILLFLLLGMILFGGTFSQVMIEFGQ